MYNDGDQIHFPVSGIATGKRRGWVMESVVAIGNSNIQLSGNHLNNTTVGFGTTALVKVVHDNTNAFKTAIDTNVASGGNYLEIPSGTYYAQELIIPTGFTLRDSSSTTQTIVSGNTLNVGVDDKTIQVSSDALRLKGISQTVNGDILFGANGADGGYSRLPLGTYDSTNSVGQILQVGSSNNLAWSNTIDGGTFS